MKTILKEQPQALPKTKYSGHFSGHKRYPSFHFDSGDRLVFIDKGVKQVLVASKDIPAFQEWLSVVVTGEEKTTKIMAYMHQPVPDFEEVQKAKGGL